MEILFENQVDVATVPIEDILHKVVAEVLTTEGYHQDIELSVTIVDAQEIQRLNKEFREIDKVTDVLSFPLLEADEVADVFAQGDQVILGDIVLCYEKAVAQAEDYGHSLKREVAFLFAHSMLHLLGYDHMTPEEESEMFALQELILLKAGFLRQ